MNYHPEAEKTLVRFILLNAFVSMPLLYFCLEDEGLYQNYTRTEFVRSAIPYLFYGLFTIPLQFILILTIPISIAILVSYPKIVSYTYCGVLALIYSVIVVSQIK